MNTIREEIILELLARGATMLTAGGEYSTNCGENVIRARTRISPTEVPCLVILPQDEQAEQKQGREKITMLVRAEGHIEFGSSDPSVIAEKILGDLRKCFTSPNWNRTRAGTPAPDDYITTISYKAGDNVYPEEGALIVGAWTHFSVVYWTATGDPYTQ